MAVIYIARPKVTYRSVRAWSDKADHYSDVVICSSCIALVASKAGLDQEGFRKVKEDLRQGFFGFHSSTVANISSVKEIFRREKLWPQTLFSRIRGENFDHMPTLTKQNCFTCFNLHECKESVKFSNSKHPNYKQKFYLISDYSNWGRYICHVAPLK